MLVNSNKLNFERESYEFAPGENKKADAQQFWPLSEHEADKV